MEKIYKNLILIQIIAYNLNLIAKLIKNLVLIIQILILIHIPFLVVNILQCFLDNQLNLLYKMEHHFLLILKI